MSRPPLARERVLDAFESLLIDDGERAATLEATAHAAGVSKGGLLYHFASKDELVHGLLERLETRALADLEAMAADPRGPIDYFLRSSIMEGEPFDRTLFAAARLGQGGHEESIRALRALRARWADALRPHVRDDAAVDLVLMVSDGLYFNNALRDEMSALTTPVPRGEALEALIDRVLDASTPLSPPGPRSGG